MKKVILFFVLSINVYSQQDTITVNKQEIISIEQDIHTQDQRTGCHVLKKVYSYFVSLINIFYY